MRLQVGFGAGLRPEGLDVEGFEDQGLLEVWVGVGLHMCLKSAEPQAIAPPPSPERRS